MRSSKSRSRNKNNRNRSVGNILNRVFDSSGPEGKVRGTPQQIIDKYNQLARDAQLSNDRVATENFQQHAEHYLRLLAEAQKEQQERQERQQQQNAQNNENRQRRQDQQGDGEGDGGETRNEAQTPSQDQGNEPKRDRPRRGKREDVIDLDASGEESGLVETPEGKPQKQRRSRKKSEENPATEQNSDPEHTPDAAE